MTADPPEAPVEKLGWVVRTSGAQADKGAAQAQEVPSEQAERRGRLAELAGQPARVAARAASAGFPLAGLATLGQGAPAGKQLVERAA